MYLTKRKKQHDLGTVKYSTVYGGVGDTGHRMMEKRSNVSKGQTGVK